MSIVKSTCKKFRLLLKSNLMYTLYINFRHLPFRVAIRLPVIIYPRTKFIILKGAKLKFDRSKLEFGSIRIGVPELFYQQSKVYTRIINRGILSFGNDILIHAGFCCNIAKSGKLHFYNKIKIGTNVKLVCLKEIVIKNNVRIAFECNIFDTGFHYIENTGNSTIDSLAKPVIINDYCWIGNKATINQGTVLPGHTIVASNSLLNKDYTTLIAENSLIAGMPAKLIKGNVRRIWDSERENILMQEENLRWI